MDIDEQLKALRGKLEECINLQQDMHKYLEELDRRIRIIENFIMENREIENEIEAEEEEIEFEFPSDPSDLHDILRSGYII